MSILTNPGIAGVCFFSPLCYNSIKEGETMKYKLLHQEGLKAIACITMLIDHVGALFFPGTMWLRIIGRIAFPIYCFLLAEGAHYTKNPAKYALRLFIGLLLAEIPFDLAFYGKITFAKQSVMFTLLLSYLMSLCMKKLPLWGKVLAVIPFALAANYLKTDYGATGVVLCAVFIIGRELPNAFALQTVGAALTNFSRITVSRIQPYATLAMIPIGLYSGKKCTNSKILQWVFYLFYPAHLLILYLIKVL